MQSPELLHVWQAAERHLAANDHAAASAAYRQLLDDPQFGPLAHLRLSLIASGQQRYRESIEQAMLAFEKRAPDPDLLAMLAKRLAVLGETRAALDCAMDPQMLHADGASLAGIGRLLSDASCPMEARQLLRRACQRGGDSPGVRYLLGLNRLYAEGGRAAADEHRDVLRHHAVAHQLEHLGGDQLRLGSASTGRHLGSRALQAGAQGGRLLGTGRRQLHPGFLQLQDLLEQIGRRLGLPRGAQPHALELQEILHPAHRIAQRAVRRVHGGRGLQADGLLFRRAQAEVVRMETPVERMESPPEIRPVERQPALETQHRPVIRARREGLEATALGADIPRGGAAAAAPALRSVLLAHLTHP